MFIVRCVAEQIESFSAPQAQKTKCQCKPKRKVIISSSKPQTSWDQDRSFFLVFDAEWLATARCYLLPNRCEYSPKLDTNSNPKVYFSSMKMQSLGPSCHSEEILMLLLLTGMLALNFQTAFDCQKFFETKVFFRHPCCIMVLT